MLFAYQSIKVYSRTSYAQKIAHDYVVTSNAAKRFLMRKQNKELTIIEIYVTLQLSLLVRKMRMQSMHLFFSNDNNNKSLFSEDDI